MGNWWGWADKTPLNRPDRYLEGSVLGLHKIALGATTKPVWFKDPGFHSLGFYRCFAYSFPVFSFAVRPSFGRNL
jgi:hypothetical protein